MRRTNAAVLLTILPAAALLGACAGADLKPVASLNASNMMSPSGYSETKVSDTQYQVQAAGTEATPKARIEKIARARAAQIGVEEKMKFYKVASVQHGVACQKAHEFYKGGTTSKGSRQTVVLDVVYAKEQADPTFVSTADSYTALSGELASEEVPPEAKAAAEQEARAGCGQPT
jgi:hypothetical protein